MGLTLAARNYTFAIFFLNRKIQNHVPHWSDFGNVPSQVSMSLTQWLLERLSIIRNQNDFSAYRRSCVTWYVRTMTLASLMHTEYFTDHRNSGNSTRSYRNRQDYTILQKVDVHSPQPTENLNRGREDYGVLLDTCL